MPIDSHQDDLPQPTTSMPLQSATQQAVASTTPNEIPLETPPPEDQLDGPIFRYADPAQIRTLASCPIHMIFNLTRPEWKG